LLFEIFGPDDSARPSYVDDYMPYYPWIDLIPLAENETEGIFIFYSYTMHTSRGIATPIHCHDANQISFLPLPTIVTKLRVDSLGVR
jgi:hypothetical protein